MQKSNFLDVLGSIANVFGWLIMAGIAIYALYRGFIKAEQANWKDVAEVRLAAIRDQQDLINRLRQEIADLEAEQRSAKRGRHRDGETQN